MYTPTNTTEVEYTVEFNRANTFDKFLSVITQSDTFLEVEMTTNQSTMSFTLPRAIVRSFERMRKIFMVNECEYHLDKIITTAIYK